MRTSCHQITALTLLPALLALADAAPDARNPSDTTSRARVPQRWTPAAIASAQYESSPAFTPDGRELYYMLSDTSFDHYRLMWTRCERGTWQAPRPVPFAAPAGAADADPFVAHDGRRLYFISTRHDPRGEDFDIWFVERRANGDWSAARRLPAPVNSPGAELWPRVDAAGAIVFGSNRPGGHGGGDIYRATPAPDGGWSVSNFGPPVSTAAHEYEAEISRDGRRLVVVADRGDRSHLYLFEKDRSSNEAPRTGARNTASQNGGLANEGRAGDGGWMQRARIEARRDVFQVGPLLSPSGDRLLFAQADADPGRSGELFLIDLTAQPARDWPPRCAR